MARKIEVDLTADTSDFEAGMKDAAMAVDRLEDKMKSADGQSSRFADGLDKTTSGLENTTSKLRSTNDLVDGFASVVGLSLPPQASMILGFADMADGMSGLLAPALTKAQVLFKGLNTTMLSNPIFLVIAALVALTAAFVIAYKKSETFRNIVNGVFDSIKKATGAFVDYVSDAVQGAAKTIGKVADIITAPYRIAFKTIANMWNATLGGFHIGIPGFKVPFGPSFGGFGFTIPNLPVPALANGGIVASPTLALIGERGPEAVVPLTGPGSRGVGGARDVTVVLQVDLDTIIRKRVRLVGGGSVQAAYGSN